MKVVLFWLFHWWGSVFPPARYKSSRFSRRSELSTYVTKALLIALMFTTQLVTAEPTEIFPGMEVEYKPYNGDVAGLNFSSDIPLWYGVYNKDKFSSPDTPAYAHFFEPSLIPPTDITNLKSWLSPFDTFIPFTSIDDDLMKETANLDVAVFFNNSNTLWDSPQWMNIMKATAIGMRGIQAATIATPGSLNKFIDKAPYLSKSILRGVKLADDLGRILGSSKPYLKAIVGFLSSSQAFCGLLAEANPNIIWDDTKITPQECLFFQNSITAAEELIKNLPDPSNSSKNTSFVESYEEIIGGFSKEEKIITIEKLIATVAVDQDVIERFIVNKTIVEYLWLQGLSSKTITTKSSGVTNITKEQVSRFFIGLSKKNTSAQTTLTIEEKTAVQEVLVTFCAKEFAGTIGSGILKEIRGKLNVIEVITQLSTWMSNMFKVRSSIINNTINPNWKAVLASTGLIFEKVFEEFLEVTGEQLGITVTDGLEVLQSLTPLKIFKVGTVFIDGGEMMWHYVVNPEVVYLNIDKKAGNQLTFTHTAPKLESVRYLSVEKEKADSVISTSDTVISRTYTADGKTYYIVPADSESKLAHFLVASGFKASVENHAIVRNKGDKSALNTLIDEQKGKVFWHSYKYDGDIAKGIGDAPTLGSRNKNNAFSSSYANYINFWERDLSSDWFVIQPYLNGTYPVLDQYVQVHKLFPSQNVSYLDFSAIYEDTFLTHITEGVYSDATWFQIGDAGKADLYANTFNIYVLKDLSRYKDSFLKSSCVWSGKTGNYLNIATNVLSPYYVAVKSGGAWIDIKENGIPHQRVELNKSLDGTIYVYDYILRAWENTVLKGEPEKFQSLLEPPLGQPSKLGNHIISFKLSDVNNRCPFSDVPVNQWYTKAIVELKNLNIIEGRENGSFGLNNPVSRAEFLKMAMLAADSSKKSSDFPQTKTGFSDVESHWASGYIDAAHKSGIISGILLKSGKSVFEPENVVNRAAAAKMTAITFGWIAPKKQRAPLDLSKPTYEIGYDLALNSWDYLSSQIKMACPSFYDVKNGEWYCQFISILNQYGIMTGSLDKTSGKMVFRPGDQMPREEAATAICRAYSYKKQYNTALCD